MNVCAIYIFMKFYMLLYHKLFPGFIFLETQLTPFPVAADFKSFPVLNCYFLQAVFICIVCVTLMGLRGRHSPLSGLPPSSDKITVTKWSSPLTSRMCSNIQALTPARSIFGPTRPANYGARLRPGDLMPWLMVSISALTNV